MMIHKTASIVVGRWAQMADGCGRTIISPQLLCTCIVFLETSSAVAQPALGPRSLVLGPVNSSFLDVSPSVSSDGNTIVFSSGQSPIVGGFHDLFVSTRSTPEDEWGEPENLGFPISDTSFDDGPYLNADGRTLYFVDEVWFSDSGPHRPGGEGNGDIWVSHRMCGTDCEFSVPKNLGEINSEFYEGGVSLSRDELTLFFDSNRPGGNGKTDMWMATRETKSSPWNVPVNLGESLNSDSHDVQPRIASNGLHLFFASDRDGLDNYDIWVSSP